jgi:type VI secretion system protein ImpK
MQEAIAQLVFPVISHGLRLKERLAGGDVPDIDSERAELKRRLTNPDAYRLSDFAGEESKNLTITRGGSQPYLGIKYALVAWLDEIFSEDPYWGNQWVERALESELYGSRIRAELFWEQAARAESRPGGDALEVYFLCVMLGFRGVKADQPEDLQNWVTTTQARIARSQGGEWPAPSELDPPINVPPLRGRDQVQRMVLVAGMVLLVFTPILTLLAFLSTRQ